MQNQIAQRVPSSRSSFSNAGIRQPVRGKPHLVLIRGFWRVSTWNPLMVARWEAAHRWATGKNYKRITQHVPQD